MQHYMAHNRQKKIRQAKSLPKVLLDIVFAFCSPSDFFASYRAVCQDWRAGRPLWTHFSSAHSRFLKSKPSFEEGDAWVLSLTHISCSLLQHTLVRVVLTCRNLKSLEAEGCCCQTLEAGLALAGSNIETLKLGKVSDVVLQSLVDMRYLTRLWLTDKCCPCECWQRRHRNNIELFAVFTRLKSLRLRSMYRTDINLFQLAALNGLEALELSLGSCQSQRNLQHLSNSLLNLRCLHLEIVDHYAWFMDTIALFIGLTDLALVLKQFHSVGPLHKLTLLKRLKLDASRSRYHLDGAECGVLIESLPRIEHVCIPYCDLVFNSKTNLTELKTRSVVRAKWLTLASWTCLQSLHLNFIYQYKFENVSLHLLVSLHTLVVSDFMVDYPNSELEMISTLPTLEVLVYNAHKITDTGLSHLAKLNKTLTSLELGGLRHVTPTGITFLTYMSLLKSFVVHSLGADCVKQLAACCKTSSLKIKCSVPCEDDVIDDLLKTPGLKQLFLSGAMLEQAERLKSPTSCVHLNKSR